MTKVSLFLYFDYAVIAAGLVLFITAIVPTVEYACTNNI